MNWDFFKAQFEYEEMLPDFDSPWAGHKRFGYDLIRNFRPKRIVELGTHKGTSFFSFCQAVKDGNLETKLFAVDTWKGDEHAGFYDEKVWNEVNAIKDRYYPDISINLLRKTFDEALSEFDNESIDILHIDGLHTYEAVKHDFESWLPKMARDGIVLFHDIVVKKDDFGVYRFWKELGDKYVTAEFLHSYGLGVLFLDHEMKSETEGLRETWQRPYQLATENILRGENDLLKERNEELEREKGGLLERTHEIDGLKRSLEQKEQEIALMQSSFFWKLRNYYIRLLDQNKFVYKLTKPARKKIRTLLFRWGVFFGIRSKIQSVWPIKKRTYYPDDSWPSFSVVSVLYNKSNEVRFFLESFFSQEYKGELELILVDDTSSDDTVAVVEAFVEEKKRNGVVWPRVSIVRNEENIGNCGSRNKGIRNALGDIVVVIDADCVVNDSFLRHHAEAYFPGDCDVAIGPFNIETKGRNPRSVISYYEKNIAEASRDAEFQDKLNKRSFLNCITRNFSIRKSFIEGDLFDELFSYSRDPGSGFGWEDVEMGYRLYMRGVRIKFLPDAFSIHVSHPPTSAKDIPLRSLKNFRRLFEKHPELVLVARRWALDTYGKICEWIRRTGLPDTEDREYLENLFQRFLQTPLYSPDLTRRRLKILSYRWHCGHQYEIYKLPHDFTLVTGLGSGISESWDYERRPFPDNVEMKHIDDIHIRDYDLAILHFDENVLAPENTNGVIGPDWGMSFQWFHDHVKLPKIAVCHGTPQFYGQYGGHCRGQELMEVMEEERKRLVDYLADTLVVVNSYQAQREWGFRHSKVIWHGFDPTEFFSGTHERNKALLMGEKSMSHRPHYNGYILAKEVFSGMSKDMSKECFEHLSTPAPDPFYEKGTNEYAYGKFRNYADELGKYSIYFNPSLRSPMPRTRAEAMMCGTTVVTTKNHDVELFIKNGVNGFYSDSPDELRSYLKYLLDHPEKAREIGEAGRRTAMDIFNHDRFLEAWKENLEEVLKS